MPVAFVPLRSAKNKKMNAGAEIAREVNMDVVLNDGDVKWREVGRKRRVFLMFSIRRMPKSAAGHLPARSFSRVPTYT